MHVPGLLRAPLPLDLNLFLQFILTALILALGFLYLVKNTASKYFAVDDDANFDYNNNNPPSSESKMPGIILDNSCAVCSNSTTKLCSGCKLVRYCSTACQRYHWNSGHQKTCKKGRQRSTAVSLVPASGSLESLQDSKKVLFPYEEFVRLYYWERPGFPPCGLLNCGNSCFANVVLQCLACTRPLVAYLLEKGHQRECRRNDWCFMCEFQSHVERATQTRQPFSPINILSRLPNIGGNLGYGKQEDAHEFMRFAIDTMQSACLDEFGGEKAVHPRALETTLIQHIFGGHLQSQVICARCGNISNQFENMMDLTVEIQGDASSLEECLDQFTVKERLHGDNMYKCDGCNDYVLAWKRLTIRQAPNILTIALKRFQSGRFGKLNKRVSFPETLDLSPYMSEAANSRDVYKLYGVIVHVDMLNASFFGHYICYTKDFSGNWYRIDDCKVSRVELDEVLSQGAYMLLYGRVFVRPSCLSNMEPLNKCEERKSEVAQETVPCAEQTVVEREEPSSGSQVLKEDIDMVDTDVDVFGSGCSVAEEGNISALEPPHRPHTLAITGAFSLERDPPMSTVEKKSWADANRPVKPASTDIDMDIDMVDNSNNGVCENGKALHDGSGSILSGDKVLLDDKADPFISNSDDVAGKDDLKVSGSTLTPLSSANLLEKRPKVSGSESMPAFPAGFLEKCPKVLGSESTRVSLASGAGEHVPMDCTVSSTGPSNNGVCENGEAVHDGSDATLSGGEVLDNKTDPFISSTDDVAGKKDVIKVSGSKLTSLLPAGFIEQRPKVSGSKSKPLIPAGFLDKRPKKTHSKQEAKATTEIIGEMPLFPADSLEKRPKKNFSEQRAKAPVSIGESKSACNLNGQRNGFTKSDSSHLNNGDIIGNGRKPHFPSDEDQMVTSQSSESNGKPEIVESGKALPSSCGTADDVTRINVRRNNSGSKLKPTFTPGFLDTRTKKKTF